MSEAIKFWIAKEIAELMWLGGFLFVIIVVGIAIAFVCEHKKK